MLKSPSHWSCHIYFLALEYNLSYNLNTFFVVFKISTVFNFNQVLTVYKALEYVMGRGSTRCEPGAARYKMFLGFRMASDKKLIIWWWESYLTLQISRKFRLWYGNINILYKVWWSKWILTWRKKEGLLNGNIILDVPWNKEDFNKHSIWGQEVAWVNHMVKSRKLELVRTNLKIRMTLQAR